MSKEPKTASVSLLPCWLLRWKGKLDGIFGGEAVVRNTISVYYDRLYSIEHEEVVRTEKALAPTRQRAAELIAAADAAKKAAADPPKLDSGDSAEAVRKNRRALSEYNRAVAFGDSASKELIAAMIAEESADSVLEQRIMRARDNAAVKVESYKTGAHSVRRLHDFEPPARPENDHAYDLYRQAHAAVDELIRASAWKAMDAANADEGRNAL